MVSNCESASYFKKIAGQSGFKVDIWGTPGFKRDNGAFNTKQKLHVVVWSMIS